MQKYLSYFQISLKSMYAYKGDFFLYMAINMVFFYVSIALWSTVYKSGGLTTIDNYTLSNTITYYLISVLIFRFDINNALYFAEEIWSGEFTNNVMRPWNVISSYFLLMVSDIFMGLLSFIPFLIFMVLTSYQFINIPTIGNLIFFCITLLAAFIMNFFFNLILHSLTFYFGDQYAQIELTNYVTSYFAGAIFPIAFLSGALKEIFMILPFKFLFFIPAEIFLGKVSVHQMLLYWAEILVWIGIFYLIFSIVYNRGLKLYHGTGR